MSNSEETAQNAAEKKETSQTATADNAPKSNSEVKPADKVEKPESVKADNEKSAQAPKTKKKTAKKASKKKAPRAKEGAEAKSEGASSEPSSKAPGAKSEDSVERKEPIQGVRDTRTKKEEPADKPESRQSGDEQQRESRDLDGDGSQQGAKRNRRGRRGRKSTEQPVQPPKPVVKVDHKEMSKKAWKIFLGEVNEEGLALIGDKEAKELAKRSFRLAELFLEEESRRLPGAEAKRDSEPRRENESRRERPSRDKADAPKPEAKAEEAVVEQKQEQALDSAEPAGSEAVEKADAPVVVEAGDQVDTAAE